MKTILRMLLSGLLALSIAPASATVAFSNFGPIDSFNIFSGWTIGGSENYTQGDQFVAGASGNLTDLYVAMAKTNGTTDDLVITLRADAGGSLGAILETFVIDVAGVPGFTLNDRNPIHLSASGLVALTGGTAYWLIAATTSTFGYAWNMNNQGDTGPHYCEPACTFNVNPNVRGAFRVEVGDAMVPEPGSLALLGIGIVAMGWKRRRLRTR